MKCLKCGSIIDSVEECLYCKTIQEDFLFDNLNDLSLKQILSFIFFKLGDNLKTIKAALNDLLLNYEVEKNILEMILTDNFLDQIKEISNFEDANRIITIESKKLNKMYGMSEELVQSIIVSLISSINPEIDLEEKYKKSNTYKKETTSISNPNKKSIFNLKRIFLSIFIIVVIVSGSYFFLFQLDSPKQDNFIEEDLPVGDETSEIENNDNTGSERVTEGLVINFPDKNLEAVIRNEVRLDSGHIYESDVKGIYELVAENSRISDLEGIQYLSNLTKINLGGNAISDLSPLANLTSLRELNLWGNNINHLGDLTTLTGLVKLNLNENQIESLNGIGYLTNLEYLDLGWNNISDISNLKWLTKLFQVALQGNQVSDVSVLSNLSNIRVISLSDNNISDISALSNIDYLQFLSLSNNPISDFTPLNGIKIDELKKGSIINFLDSNFENAVRDEINKPTGDIYDTDVMSLKVLEAMGLEITSIEGIQYFFNLEELQLGHNEISDIGPLANLTNLKILDLMGNNITDIEPIKNLLNLKGLYLRDNQISDVSPISYLVKLENLYIENNPITDYSILDELDAYDVNY